MENDQGLNPQQLTAANHIEGPLLVLAGAGSGKTRIVTKRVAHLISLGVSPKEIIAVTFTNKAAEEMRGRIQALTHSYVLSCTFHSLCARILRESISHLGYTSDFLIYDEDDSEKLLKLCFAALDIKENKGDLKTIRGLISNAKNALLGPEQATEEEPNLKALYRLYQQRLKQYNALDFDDLLFLTVELFKSHPDVLNIYQTRWKFVLIDEYQDTNAAQDLIARLLVQKHGNIFVVGDPDQSIYSWRGANIQNILDFGLHFAGTTVVRLEQNYRSTNTILKASNAVIAANKGRYEKQLWSSLGDGEKIGLMISQSDRDEAQFIIDKILSHRKKDNLSLDDCVIFYRTNFQSRVLEDALIRQGLPYEIIGGISFYQRREIKDILALLRLIVTDADYLSFTRTINTPKRGWGESILASLRSASEDSNTPIFQTCERILHGLLPFKMSAKQKEGLTSFVSMIRQLRAKAKEMPLSELIAEAIDRSDYRTYLKEEPETYKDRIANITELTSKAAEWEKETENPTLLKFLEELTLKSSTDELAHDDQSIKLMTLHNGKGLEFRVVFISGLEEELFPHLNSRDTQDQIEEERRLFYVGMTRAKEKLYLTACRYRFLWGAGRMMRQSRFIKEVPEEYVEDLARKVQPQPFSDNPFESPTESSDQEFFPGDQVAHHVFGEGIIRRAFKGSLGQMYEVYFTDEKQTRSLIAKYAKLSHA